MPIGVYRDLDGAVAHLIFHIDERRAILNEQTSKGVTEIVETKTTEPSFFNARQKIVVNQVRGVQNRSCLREKDQIVGYGRFSF